jgi:hypothetical protein
MPLRADRALSVPWSYRDVTETVVDSEPQPHRFLYDPYTRGDTAPLIPLLHEHSPRLHSPLRDALLTVSGPQALLEQQLHLFQSRQPSLETQILLTHALRHPARRTRMHTAPTRPMTPAFSIMIIVAKQQEGADNGRR